MSDFLYKLKCHYNQRKACVDRLALISDFIEQGIDVFSEEDSYGNTIFHYLVKYHDDELLNLIVGTFKEVGKKIFFRTNKYGQSPLFSIKDIRNPLDYSNNIKNIVLTLISNGCNPNRRDENDKLFYFDSAYRGLYSVFEAMNQLNISYNKTNLSDGKNVLHEAIEALNRIDFYLKNPDKYQQEEMPFIKTIEEILKSNIDIGQKTNIGKSAYDFALETKNLKVVSLIEKVSASDKTYGVKLCDAALYGYKTIVDEYIKIGALLDGTYNGFFKELENLRAIDIASKNLQFDVIESLLKKEPALCSINPITGKSPFYYFAKSLFISKVSILGSKTADNYKKITKLFLNIPNFNNLYVDEEENTPINLLASFASRFNYIDEGYAEKIIFNELIKNDFDVEKVDKYGNSVLHNLFKNASKEAGDMLEELKTYNLDFNKKNNFGLTPFMLLIDVYRESDALILLESVEDQNFDLSIVNNEGKTALTLLIEAKKEEIAKKLIELGGI